eukprot:COSAG03_NODE_16707_length_394_cov_0.871186_2_plen_94_part_01
MVHAISSYQQVCVSSHSPRSPPVQRLTGRDRYTENNTEYPLDLNLNQLYFPIERFGVGLCPLGCGHPQPTEHCVAQRIAAAVLYGATEIDLWSM